MCGCMCVCAHTHTHEHTHTHTHTRTHTHAHAHTRTRTYTGVLGDGAETRVGQGDDRTHWPGVCCVAGCCSVLQCVAACCSVLTIERTGRIFVVLQCVAV